MHTIAPLSPLPEVTGTTDLNGRTQPGNTTTAPFRPLIELDGSSAGELAADVSHLIDDEPVNAYRENALERVVRWLNKNRFLVLLVLAYLLMRIFFIFTSRR